LATTRELINRELAIFLEEVRCDLRNRLEFNWHALELDGEDAKLLRMWYTALGVIAYDISGDIVRLCEVGSPRSAQILLRPLLEYAIRVEYYLNHIEEARADSAQVNERFLKMMRVEPAQYVAEYPAEEQQKYAAAKAMDKLKVSNRQVWDMIRALHPNEDDARLLNDRIYALQSVLVHGNEGIMPDVYRNLFMGLDPGNQLDWETHRWLPQDIVGVACQLLIELLGVIERAGGRGNARSVLNRKFDNIEKRLGRTPRRIRHQA
jgi:hypothetical protein